MPRLFGSDTPPTTEMIVSLLQQEARAIREGKDVPIAFLCSVAGPLTEWALATLPRRGSGEHNSTENERLLLHQLLGQINALADIY